MKILVFDTETTGLPKFRNASISNTHHWPHVIQLSFIYYDMELNNLIDYADYFINIPSNVEIEPQAQAIHGISRTILEEQGVDLNFALEHFDLRLQEADVIMGHNISFDKKMLMVEAIRNKRQQYFTRNGIRKNEICTMKESVPICQINVVNKQTGQSYFKFPKLMELHNHLFGYTPEGLHDSFADILCCLRCYMKMKYGRDIIYDNRSIAKLWREKCIPMT